MRNLESIDYVQNIISPPCDADQLIPVTHLKALLAEIARQDNRIRTQQDLLNVYRTRLGEAESTS